MNTEAASKVAARHLKRRALLYVRQSTLRQVMENTESTKRQYDLRQRALALGWPLESIQVVDDDQGHSGASAQDRQGFQRLVAEVGMGHVGLVMGLEVSRLARNSADWHRLLEICALSDTLILDEDGLYDPCHFNDRLLLGLKGTMSEAELHVLRARLRGGVLSKAKRGELEIPLPIGFLYDAAGRVVLDPDQQVQQTLRTFFSTFERTGSALATVRAFREQGLLAPRHGQAGCARDGVIWAPLQHSRALQFLHNPRYAGVFCFGRLRCRPGPDGKVHCQRLPREEWIAYIPGAHPGYINPEQFEDNQRRLRENTLARAADRRAPPREGPALLQGLVVCGRCGKRMTVRYHYEDGKPCTSYVCIRESAQRGQPPCQIIMGRDLDAALGKLLLEAVSPLAIELTLQVQQELVQRAQEANRLRQQGVERARYEAELARRRYMQVDPDSRLVASELEAQWNERLRAVAAAQDEVDRQTRDEVRVLDVGQRERVLALASDLPRLWADSRTDDRERKRMARLVIEDVTLVKDSDIIAHVRFRGGATHTLTVPRPLASWEKRVTPADVVKEVDNMIATGTDVEIAAALNARGLRSGTKKTFTAATVRHIRLSYGLTDRYTRLRAAGLLTGEELAQRLGISYGTLKVWRRCGLIESERYDDKGSCLYAIPEDGGPVRYKHKNLRARKGRTDLPKEV